MMRDEEEEEEDEKEVHGFSSLRHIWRRKKTSATLVSLSLHCLFIYSKIHVYWGLRTAEENLHNLFMTFPHTTLSLSLLPLLYNIHSFLLLFFFLPYFPNSPSSFHPRTLIYSVSSQNISHRQTHSNRNSSHLKSSEGKFMFNTSCYPWTLAIWNEQIRYREREAAGNERSATGYECG